MGFSYRFPVTRGIQAGREYFIAMVPWNTIPRLFPHDNEYVSPEYRAQRQLNESRIPVIRDYILHNPENYVFSALAASIDGDFRFLPAAEGADIGILEISMDARFLINDGQHRKAAILEALREDPRFKDETIPVVFFEDQGLARSQQIFTDLNKHAVKTSNSISELYDSRDPLAVITRKVITNVPFLNKYTDKEKDILGKYSSNLFTLNTFYAANKKILQGMDQQESCEEFLSDYWSHVAENLIPWNELAHREITKLDLRETYIVTQAVVIQALGRVGNYFYRTPSVHLSRLQKLQDIDWRRSAEIWQLRTIGNNGRIISSGTAAILTANAIKQMLELPLDREEQAKEEKFLNSRMRV